jgi:hypothetical protein
MSRIKEIIKEVISKHLKKEDKCNCGCHTCENVGNSGVLINESLNKKINITENLQYHVDNKLPLTENTFRYGSQSFLDLWAEARYLYVREAIHISDEDKEILTETNLGEYGMYEGVKVPLDLPLEENIRLSVRANEIPLMDILSRAQEKGHDKYPFYKELVDELGKDSIDLNRVKNVLEDYGVFFEYADLLNLNEAEDKKNPPLGKPKRGGSKKFYVYVKDPKTKKIKKVSFGGTTGLSVKINDPKARQAFAARHKCSEKTDRTKPSYWSCRIGRYWKQLGGEKNFSGYW